MGDGLLVRARALSFALLGLITAVGLGLVVFISHLGWPNVLGGPIPGLPAEHSAVHSRVIASHPTVPISGPSHGSGSKPTVAPAPPRIRATLVASGLSGSRKVVAPSPPPSHGNDQPSGNGAPSGPPGSQPPVAAPAPAPAPAAASPPSTVASVAGSPQSHGKGSEHRSKGNSPSASKSKAYYPVPQAPAVTARPPSPVAAGPGKDGPSPTSGETGDGHGHGHAYGHYVK